GDLPQRIFLQFGLGQQPLQPRVLLAQLLEFLGGIGIHPAVRAAPVVQCVAADTPSSAAITSPVLPAALSSSARRSLRTMSSAECRLRPAIYLSSHPAQHRAKDSKTGWTHSQGTRQRR